MKRTIIIAVLAALVGISQADYNIGFNVGYGVRSNDGSTGLLPNANDVAVMQLIYVGENGVIDYAKPSVNGVLGDITLTGAEAVGDTLDGDDILIGLFTFVNTGAAFEDEAFGASSVINGAFLGADVYGRIIGAGGDGISDGDWFYQGGLFVAENQNLGAVPPPLAQDYAIDGGVSVFANSGQVIPEPATIGLMGIAGLGMYLARRKVRR
jgi:hypothetical protein